MEDKLNSKTYQTISQRMQTEEATCALTMSTRCDNEDSEYVPWQNAMSFSIIICNVPKLNPSFSHLGDTQKQELTMMETEVNQRWRSGRLWEKMETTWPRLPMLPIMLSVGWATCLAKALVVSLANLVVEAGSRIVVILLWFVIYLIKASVEFVLWLSSACDCLP